MTLTASLASGDSTALRMTKSLLTLPALIGMTDESDTEILKKIPTLKGIPFYIPLEVENHSQIGSAQVSENLIISTGKDTKNYMTDNVAPGAWSWNMTGWIPGNSLVEKTNLFCPIVMLHKDIVRRAFRQGLRMKFKDTDCRFYDVVIQELSIDTTPDCQNKTPFSMTLKQVEVLQASESQMTITEKESTIPEGEAGGLTASMGTTAAQDNKTLAIKGLNAVGIDLSSFK